MYRYSNFNYILGVKFIKKQLILGAKVPKMNTHTPYTLLPVGVTAAVALTIYGSLHNWQGRENLEGTVMAKQARCDNLVDYLHADKSYKDKCSSTLLVRTDEGAYTIGALGRLGNNIGVGSRVTFVKKSTRFVTSFDDKKMGFLSAGKITSIEGRK